MAGSLQDQLLKSGLANKKQAKQANEHKRKKAKQKKAGTAVDDKQAQQAALEAARQEKAAHDRELNLQRQQEQAQKAALAEARQLIEAHRLRLPQKAETRYNFAHGSTIHHLYLDQKLIDQLARGQLRIAFMDASYHLVPAEIVDRVEKRQPDMILPRPVDDTPDADDPYADFAIPDDLMW
ncbi:MAG: DUF2058 domain-containing protein [Oceanospirillales bacterium]|uniref:Nucleoprotein/polynucleotide-associated enzyme n=1 Tax=Marinobacterium halophilum TaxID=267374 RepID=A0A2P8F201_9GAMM|nr:DUF2058 domain-containing protein [Marinobacterium halophilum]MBR9830453.1 DUF2058 domain-containing protein [Oceanospirillales bacterium]PSL15740.1 hypothetical protein CLV44_10321 [Marinobacterium halophilum]